MSIYDALPRGRVNGLVLGRRLHMADYSIVLWCPRLIFRRIAECIRESVKTRVWV